MATPSATDLQLLLQHQVYTLFCNTYLNVPITYDIQVLKYLKSLKKTTDLDMATIVERINSIEKEVIYKNSVTDLLSDRTPKSIIKTIIEKIFVDSEVKSKLEKNTVMDDFKVIDTVIKADDSNSIDTINAAVDEVNENILKNIEKYINTAAAGIKTTADEIRKNNIDAAIVEIKKAIENFVNVKNDVEVTKNEVNRITIDACQAIFNSINIISSNDINSFFNKIVKKEDYEYLCLRILYCIYMHPSDNIILNKIVLNIVNIISQDDLNMVINVLQKVIPSKLVTDILVYITNHHQRIYNANEGKSNEVDMKLDNVTEDIDKYINNCIYHQIINNNVSTDKGKIDILCDENFKNMYNNIANSNSLKASALMSNLISYNIEDVCRFVYDFVKLFNNAMKTNMYTSPFNILNSFTKIDPVTCVNFVKFTKCIKGVCNVFYDYNLFPDTNFPGNYNDKNLVISDITQNQKYSNILDVNIKDKLVESNTNIFTTAVSNIEYTNFFENLEDRVCNILDNVNPNMMYNLYLNVFKILDTNVENYIKNLSDLDSHHEIISELIYGIDKTILSDHKIDDYIIHGSCNYNSTTPKLMFECSGSNVVDTYMSIILSNYCLKDNKDRKLDSSIFPNIDKLELFPDTNIKSSALYIEISTSKADVYLFGKRVYSIDYEIPGGLVLKENQQLLDFKLFGTTITKYDKATNKYNQSHRVYTFDDLLVDILFIVFIYYPHKCGNKFCTTSDTILSSDPFNISLSNYIDTFDDTYHQSITTVNRLMSGIEYIYRIGSGQNEWYSNLDNDLKKYYKECYSYFYYIYNSNNLKWHTKSKNVFKSKHFIPIYNHVKSCVDTYSRNIIDCNELSEKNITKYEIIFSDQNQYVKCTLARAYSNLGSDGNVDETSEIKLLYTYSINYKTLLENLKFMIDDIIYSDKYVRIDIYKRDETNKDKMTRVECYALISDVISIFNKLSVDPSTGLNWDQNSLNEYSESLSTRSDDGNRLGLHTVRMGPGSRGESSENPPENPDESSKKTAAFINPIDYMSVYNNYITSNTEYSLLTDIFAITYALFKLNIDTNCKINFDVYCKLLGYHNVGEEDTYYLHQIYMYSLRPYILNNLSMIYDLHCVIEKSLDKQAYDKPIRINKNDEKDINNNYYQWFNDKVTMTRDELDTIVTKRYHKNIKSDSPTTQDIQLYSKFSTSLNTSLVYTEDHAIFYTLNIDSKTYVFVNDSHLVAKYNDIVNNTNSDKIFKKVKKSDINNIEILLNKMNLIACCIFDTNNITQQYFMSNISELQQTYIDNIRPIEYARTYGPDTGVTNEEYAFKIKLMNFINTCSYVCDKLYSRNKENMNSLSNDINTFYLPFNTGSKSQELANNFNKMFVKLFFIYICNFTTSDVSRQIVYRDDATKHDYISLPLFNTSAVPANLISKTFDFINICDESNKNATKDANLGSVNVPKTIGYIYYKVFFYIHMILNIMDHNEMYCNRYSLSLILHVIHLFFDPSWYITDIYSKFCVTTEINAKNELLDLTDCFETMQMVAIKISNANMTTFTKMIEEIKSFITKCISICTVQDVLQSHTCNSSIQMLSIEALSETYVNDYTFLKRLQSKIDVAINNANASMKDDESMYDTAVENINTILSNLDNSEEFKNIESSFRYNNQFINKLRTELDKKYQDIINHKQSLESNISEVFKIYIKKLNDNVISNFTTMKNKIKEFQRSDVFQNCIVNMHQKKNIFWNKSFIDKNDAKASIPTYVQDNINGAIIKIDNVIKTLSNEKNNSSLNGICFYNNTNFITNTAKALGDYDITTLCDDDSAENGLSIVPLPAYILDNTTGKNRYNRVKQVSPTESKIVYSLRTFNILYNSILIGGLYANLLFNCFMPNIKIEFETPSTPSTPSQSLSKYNMFVNTTTVNNNIKDFVYSFGMTTNKDQSTYESTIELDRLNVQSNIPTRNGPLKINSPWDIFVNEYIEDIEENSVTISYNRITYLTQYISHNINMICNTNFSKNNDVEPLIEIFFTYLYNYIQINSSNRSSIPKNEQIVVGRFNKITKLFNYDTIKCNGIQMTELCKYIFKITDKDNRDDVENMNGEFINVCMLLLSNTGSKYTTLNLIKHNIDTITSYIFDTKTNNSGKSDDDDKKESAENNNQCNKFLLILYKLCTLSYILTHYI